jgi:putative membrane protein
VKIWLYIAAVLGIGLTVAIVIYNNAGVVLGTVLSQGPGLIAVVAFHAVPLVFSAGAWWVVTRPDWPSRFSSFLKARLLREAVNDLLPVAQLGGPLAGARLLTLDGAPGLPIAASLFVDLTLEVMSELVFAFIGIGLLALDGRAPDAVRYALIGTAILGPAVIAFVVAQRAGLVHMIDRFARNMFSRFGYDRGEAAQSLHDAVWRSYGRLGTLGFSFVLHVACWVLGAGEIWLAFYFLGHPVSIAEAVIFESLGQALRSAAFAVPAGLGVQEGGFILLGTAFGLPPNVSLAMSLTKRVREVVFGGLSLLAWQILEGKNVARSLRAPAGQEVGRSAPGAAQK